MSELEGAELAAAVAEIVRPAGYTDRNDTDGYPLCCVDGEDMEFSWCPDLGGADAWEVLEWVRGRGLRALFMTSVAGGQICLLSRRDGTEDHAGDGPTDAIALCRAVVALGGE